jgi:hypothetical protein
MTHALVGDTPKMWERFTRGKKKKLTKEETKRPPPARCNSGLFNSHRDVKKTDALLISSAGGDRDAVFTPVGAARSGPRDDSGMSRASPSVASVHT